MVAFWGVLALFPPCVGAVILVMFCTVAKDVMRNSKYSTIGRVFWGICFSLVGIIGVLLISLVSLPLQIFLS
jgi:hypothetical protein